MEEQKATDDVLTVRRPQGETLLARIRPRPPLYLGDMSIVTLRNVLNGYRYALYDYGLENETILGLPDDFHDWVAYRLHYTSTTMGWCKMILERCNGDETAGLDRFYQLLDEHAARKPRVVVKLTNVDLKYTQTVYPRGDSSEGGITTEERLPHSVSLVAYTDDPGFFVYSDEPGMVYDSSPFHPYLSWVRAKTPGAKVTILDPVTFERWMRENDEYKAARDAE